MKILKIQSPTRVDLAGGTLDLWPLWAFLETAQTVNISVNIWTKVEIQQLSKPILKVQIQDLNYTKEFQTAQDFLSSSDPQTSLVQNVVRYFLSTEKRASNLGFSISTKSESPIGGGLGGSSSLCISLIRALNEWFGTNLNTQQMVTLASNLEARMLNVPTGIQDYVPALLGGQHTLQFSPLGPTWTSRPFDPDNFKNFILVYTGQPHQSGLNNWDVLQKAVNKNTSTLNALSELKIVAQKVEKLLSEKFDWKELSSLMDQEYQHRVMLSPSISSPGIQELRSLIKSTSPQAALKICGAGGGGCVLVVCDSAIKTEIENQIRKLNYKIMDQVAPVNVVPAADWSGLS